MRIPSPALLLLPFIGLLGCAGGDDGDPTPDETDTGSAIDSDSDPLHSGLLETDDTGDTEVPADREPCSDAAAEDLSGWCDLSVNRSDVIVPTTAGTALRLTLSGDNTAPPSPVGGFNGQGRGNRALAGAHTASGTLLSAIAPLALEDRAVSAPPALSLDLLLRVDLACDGVDHVMLMVQRDRWFTTTDGDWSVRTLPSDRAAFYAYGGLAAADNAQVTLVDDPQAPGRQPTTLDDILADYPDACLDNGSTDEPSLPSGTLSAVMLSTGGDLSTSDIAFWDVRTLTVGTTTWGVVAD